MRPFRRTVADPRLVAGNGVIVGEDDAVAQGNEGRWIRIGGSKREGRAGKRMGAGGGAVADPELRPLEEEEVLPGHGEAAGAVGQCLDEHGPVRGAVGLPEVIVGEEVDEAGEENRGGAAAAGNGHPRPGRRPVGPVDDVVAEVECQAGVVEEGAAGDAEADGGLGGGKARRVDVGGGVGRGAREDRVAHDAVDRETFREAAGERPGRPGSLRRAIRHPPLPAVGEEERAAVRNPRSRALHTERGARDSGHLDGPFRGAVAAPERGRRVDAIPGVEVEPVGGGRQVQRVGGGGGVSVSVEDHERPAIGAVGSPQFVAVERVRPGEIDAAVEADHRGIAVGQSEGAARADPARAASGAVAEP